MIAETLITISIVVFSSWIIISDAYLRIIPNGALIGLCFTCILDLIVYQCIDILFRILFSFVALICIGVPLHRNKILGGGDIKLIGTVIALTPVQETWDFILAFYGIFVAHVVFQFTIYLAVIRSFKLSWLRIRNYPLGIPLAGALIVKNLIN